MIRCTIDRLGLHGDGIAVTPDGPIYAPRTLPGEEIAGDAEGDRIARPRILRPVPERVTPPCPHYGGCGGCALMHARPAFTAGWKAGVVVAALAAQGLEATIGAVVTSPEASRRRAVLHGRRLKGGPVVGFHGRGSGTVVAIPHCRVLDPRIVAALPALEQITRRAGSRRSELRLTVTATQTGLDVDIAGGDGAGGGAGGGPGRTVPDAADLAADFAADLAKIAEAHDLARVTAGGETVVQRRVPVVAFDAIAVAPPPAAFLQATPQGEAALRDAIGAAVRPGDRILDLFAGCGSLSLPLARRHALHAVEGDAAQAAALDAGWRRAPGLHAVSHEVRDLFRRPLEPDELAAHDLAVIDPPRAGAEAQTRALAASGIGRVVSVSCNPVTFARDARILAGAGFRMGPVTVVDQFLWSTHVELVCGFVRE